MVYRKRRVYKKRRVTTFRNKRNYVSRVAKRVYNKMIEMKEKDYQYNNLGPDPVSGSNLSFGSISYGGSAIITRLASGIARGTNDGERIGHKIRMKGVRCFLPIQNETGALSVPTYNNVRIIMLRPKGRYTTTSTASLVQSIFSGNSSSSVQWACPVDTDYFQVLLDKKYFLRSLATGDSGSPLAPTTKFCNFYKKLNKVIEWDEQEAQPYNDIWMLAISDSAATPNPGAIAGFIRVYYQDG